MTAAEFLAAFPAIKTDYGTGGGCTAWWLDLSTDANKWLGVLITEPDDCYQPERTAKRAAFGIVNDGEGVEPRVMTWAQAAHWLRGVVDMNDARNMWGLK